MGKGSLYKVEGLKQLRSTMRKAGDDLSEFKDINRQAAGIVAGAADAPTRTGTLAASIRPAGTKTAGIVRAGRKSVPYAGPIHWGWPAHNIEAQTFLTDAAKSTEAQWVPLYQDRLEKIINTIEGA